MYTYIIIYFYAFYNLHGLKVFETIWRGDVNGIQWAHMKKWETPRMPNKELTLTTCMYIMHRQFFFSKDLQRSNPESHGALHCQFLVSASHVLYLKCNKSVSNKQLTFVTTKWKITRGSCPISAADEVSFFKLLVLPCEQERWWLLGIMIIVRKTLPLSLLFRESYFVANRRNTHPISK